MPNGLAPPQTTTNDIYNAKDNTRCLWRMNKSRPISKGGQHLEKETNSRWVSFGGRLAWVKAVAIVQHIVSSSLVERLPSFWSKQPRQLWPSGMEEESQSRENQKRWESWCFTVEEVQKLAGIRWPGNGQVQVGTQSWWCHGSWALVVIVLPLPTVFLASAPSKEKKHVKESFSCSLKR